MERASTVDPGAADAMLVFDVLVGTEPDMLATGDPARTVAIVSTNRVATGPMITDPRLTFPKLPMFMKAIDGNTRASENVYIDAERIAVALLDNALATNLFLTGVAFQKGVLPLAPEHIEHAIGLNGVAVDMNLAAFRWGRLMISHPELVQQALEGKPDAVPRRPGALFVAAVAELVGWTDGELRRRLELRAAELVDYQDIAYARSYVEFVRRTAEAEAAVSDDTALAEAVAAGLHKFMAYKDEYEVARLHLADSARAAVTSAFGPDAKVYWHLHPPVLRALGMKRKFVLGPWFTPAFQVLHRMRRVRGTASTCSATPRFAVASARSSTSTGRRSNA